MKKILGPTADYLGEQLKELAEKKMTNIKSIFENAEKKLGDKINHDGGVPPKVFKGIWEDGAWCEEGLQVEYFGGVLASSRTGISRDDRGACFLSLVSRLSTYQLRTHYLLYHLLKQQFNGEVINIYEGNKWAELQMFISFETFYNAMDFAEEEKQNCYNLLTHAIWGLDKEELITGFSYGDKNHVSKKFAAAGTDGILYQPTQMGVELFMWAYGHGQKNSNGFFDKNLVFPNEHDIKIGEGISTKKAQIKCGSEKKQPTGSSAQASESHFPPIGVGEVAHLYWNTD
jgi:hypothetical protein